MKTKSKGFLGWTTSQKWCIVQQGLIDTSDILYVDPNKKRTDSWLRALGLQLPSGLTTYGSIGKVTYYVKNVNDNNKNAAMQEAFSKALKKKEDIKYSLSDNQGRELTKEQQEYFKDSKVRDENGSLMVMYHGTPNGDFTIFKSGSYFTPKKEYADVYQAQGASSLGYKKTANNPKLDDQPKMTHRSTKKGRTLRCLLLTKFLKKFKIYLKN